MNPFTSLVDATDDFLDYIGKIGKQSISDYCDLETIDSDNTLISKNGSFLSVIRIDGMKNLVGNDDFYNQVILNLVSSTQGLFASSSYAIQFYFESDPDKTEEEIRAVLGPAFLTAERLNMDMQDLLKERAKELSNWTRSERCFAVLWTRPDSLNKKEKQIAKKERMKEAVEYGNFDKNSQNPIAAFGLLRNRHSAFIQTVNSEMKAVGIANEILSAREALKEIRKTVSGNFTSDDWVPCLPGDKVKPSIRKRKVSVDVWEIAWPPLSWQLTPRDARIVAENAVTIGDRVYAPLYVDLFPNNTNSKETFANLFSKARARSLPWRMSFLIEGGGLSGLQTKGMLSGIMGWAGNKNLNRAFKYLKRLSDEGSETIVQIRMSMSTWAPKGDMNTLEKRVADFAQILSSWSGCQASEITGDPIEGFASSALGFTQGSIGTKSAAPIDDAFILAPLSRPSSPWQTGAVTFRSEDGKILPFDPYSSKQVAWINLFFAKPGSGKSVLMNMNNLALCLKGGETRLPRISIIDIGPSSSGFISLIKESLPKNMQYLAVHKRITMDESNAINPFETQLGCRFPTPSERDFLINLVTLLATDSNKEKPTGGMPGLVTAAIDEVYRLRSDRRKPNKYSAGFVPEVDEAVRDIRIIIDFNTTWWEIEDELFRAGKTKEAYIAHRYAVPILPDLIEAAQSEKIRSEYGGDGKNELRAEGTQEFLINSFSRLMTEAIRMVKILARPTAFDLGGARIIALDLDEVAKGTGIVGERTTSIMYMLARFVTAKDFYLTNESLAHMPALDLTTLGDKVPVKEYKAFHSKRIEDIREDKKRICYDEFHRTSKSEQVRNQVLIDMREGRKWQVDIMLASQRLQDFSQDMISFATGIFIMEGGTEEGVKQIAQIFGLQSKYEEYILKHSIRGPTRGGGTFMAKFDTKNGWYTMLLANPLGPQELWALSTTAEDAQIRNKLYDKIGPIKARKYLALVYPGGGAKDDVDERKRKMKSQNQLLLAGEDDNIINQIVLEIIEVGLSYEKGYIK